ncbi:MAG: HD domain-containing protein [Eubacterium sp.]|nr:HD domain-containing protein [Eubacterium sp.]
MKFYFNKSSQKNLVYSIILIILGVLFNTLVSKSASFLEIPLYLDCIGTMSVAVIGGAAPGMLVGFITNMIGGFSDSSTFYYGTINVLIALIAGIASEKGYFDKIYKLGIALLFYMLLSIPCSVLTYILFECQIADNVAKTAVTFFHNTGLPILLSQILGDFCVEIPDKAISLLVTFGILKIVPKSIKDRFMKISGRDVINHSSKETTSSLSNQVAFILFFSGLSIVFVAFFISYKTYMEARIEDVSGGAYNVALLRKETILYSGKMLSAVLGLILCIVSFSMILAEKMVVRPLYKMSKEMRRFAFDSNAGRDKTVAKIDSLDIKTGNEIEELYHSISKTVRDIDEYIDMTEKQAKTISKLHVDIITTLADIVESRDETTGNHVKRTAMYSKVLARTLRMKGYYVDEITDEFIDILTIAAPLHDIGKIKIPDSILNKPGKLTDEEYEIMKTHTIKGKEMLDQAASTMGNTLYLKMAQNIALYHHEWWDGSRRGYPEGLSGTDIPLSARIMAVADVFDALISTRPYKQGFSIEKTLQIMKEESGTHFDPVIIEVLEESIDKMELIVDKYKD